MLDSFGRVSSNPIAVGFPWDFRYRPRVRARAFKVLTEGEIKVCMSC